MSIAYQHVGEQPIPPSRLVEGISEDLDAVVLHSLAKPRDARYQSAAEFRADLQAVRLGRPISDAARGSAAALAGAGALAAATQVVPALGGEPTQAYAAAARHRRPGYRDLPRAGGAGGEEAGRGGWIVLTLVAIAALAALAYGLSTYFGTDETPKVAVPRVVGDPDPDRHRQAGRRPSSWPTPVRQPSDTVPADDGDQPEPRPPAPRSARTARCASRVRRADARSPCPTSRG